MPSFEIDTTPEIIEKREDNSVVYSKRPKIQILLHNLKSHRYSKIPFDCLLDSGADKNLFPAHIGESVGIKIVNGEPSKHIGIGGHPLEAFRHLVNISCKGYEFSTEIDFSYQQGIPLLGREGFFVFFEEIRFIKNDKFVLVTPTK